MFTPGPLTTSRTVEEAMPAACFRIGHISRIFESDVHSLLAAIRETLAEMEIEL